MLAHERRNLTVRLMSALIDVNSYNIGFIRHFEVPMPRRTGPSVLSYDAEEALRALGQNIRTARLRRNRTLEDVASRIGVHRETLSSAEKGSSTVTIGTYAGALAIYGLLKGLADVADPEADRHGIALEGQSARQRARQGSGAMDNDF